MTDDPIERIARRYRQGLITSQHAHYLVAQRLGTNAWDTIVALAEATKKVLSR